MVKEKKKQYKKGNTTEKQLRQKRETESEDACMETST